MIATDLDHTLIWQDGALRPRTLEVLARAKEAGLHVVVVTGRMVQSLLRVFPLSLVGEPVICYQGAVVVDADGTWAWHVPMEVELAKEAIAAVEAEGYTPNVYVGDELYVSEETQWSQAYASFQGLTILSVGPFADWLQEPPTKLVVVGDPDELDALNIRMQALFAGRLTISKSLPYFLEFASPLVTKGKGLTFLGERMGFAPADTISFGDGENDIELVDWAGYGIAVANAHPLVIEVADFVCPSVDEEGVAQVVEAFLAAR